MPKRNYYNKSDQPCILCHNNANYGTYYGSDSKPHSYYKCQTCSKYFIDSKQEKFIQQNPSIIPYIQWKTRNYNGMEEGGFKITETDVSLDNLSQLPSTPLDGIDNILIWLSRQISSQEQKVKVDFEVDYPLFFAKSKNELFFWRDTAVELQLIKQSNIGGTFFQISIEGWKRLIQLKNTDIKLSKFVFVAKSFHKDLVTLYSDGILPALAETGFTPIYLDGDKRTGLIDNKIIAGIRQSRFMIADYTGQRQSVYYESGFADGLGIPVIDCCRRDDFDNMHFDKKHHTLLLWDTPEELKEQLIYAIKANII